MTWNVRFFIHQMNVRYDERTMRQRRRRIQWKRTLRTLWPCGGPLVFCNRRRRRRAVRCRRPFRCPLPSCRSWHSAATWSVWSRRTCANQRSRLTVPLHRTRSRQWWSTGTNSRVYWSDRPAPRPRSALADESGAGGYRVPRWSVLTSVCLYWVLKKNFFFKKNDWPKIVYYFGYFKYLYLYHIINYTLYLYNY